MEEPRYKIKTAATFSPVSLDEFKRNLHIGAQDEEDNIQDEYLQEILDSVTAQVQTDIGRRICRETWTLYLDDFPGEDLAITLGPVAAINSVKYYNSSNVLTTMDPADYLLDNIELTARMRFLETYNVYADRLNQVEIEFTTGWDDAIGNQGETVPEDLRDAIILLATERYLNPENMQQNFGMGFRMAAADRLLRKYRVARY